MSKSIVIAERDNIAAVFEDNKATEFFIHRGEILLGDVYLSKVENILPSIEAAFVNVGSDKMGFCTPLTSLVKADCKINCLLNRTLLYRLLKNLPVTKDQELQHQ